MAFTAPRGEHAASPHDLSTSKTTLTHQIPYTPTHQASYTLTYHTPYTITSTPYTLTHKKTYTLTQHWCARERIDHPAFTAPIGVRPALPHDLGVRVQERVRE